MGEKTTQKDYVHVYDASGRLIRTVEENWTHTEVSKEEWSIASPVMWTIVATFFPIPIVVPVIALVKLIRSIKEYGVNPLTIICMIIAVHVLAGHLFLVGCVIADALGLI